MASPHPSDDPVATNKPVPMDRGPWPSVLMRLIGEERGDSWTSVVERLQTHPEEALHNFHGGSSLHAACVRYPPLHVVEAFLQQVPEAASVKNNNGETPLHLAASSASEEVQLALIRAAPHTVALQDRYGDTPLHLAARSGAGRTILESMAQTSPTTISLKNARGMTPFWLLPRSYQAAMTLHDLQEDEDGDMALDWETVLVMLRAACPRETSVVHMAAQTPTCPRQVWNVIGRLFPPQQALQYNARGQTPLILAARADVMQEPSDYNEMEDGFQEDWEVNEEHAPMQHEHELDDDHRDDEPPAVNQESLHPQFSHLEEMLRNHQNEDEDEDTPQQVSLLELVLCWNPRAALLSDADGRLPLAHAICSNKTWRDGGIGSLLRAAPKALVTRDAITWLYPFMLAAAYSDDLDTVYNLVRSFPEHMNLAIRPSTEKENVAVSGCMAGTADSGTFKLEKKSIVPIPIDDDIEHESEPNKKPRRGSKTAT